LTGSAYCALLNTKARSISYEYDRAGNLVKQILPNGGVIINEYDEMNRRIRVTDPDGNITRIFYDNSGNVVNMSIRKITIREETTEQVPHTFMTQ